MKVLFFASLRETMACSEMVLTSDQPETVKALMAQIFLPDGQSLASLCIASQALLMAQIFLPDGQSLASYAETESLLLAVNQQMVDGDAPLNANDEVAFFPPVTGG